MGQTGPKTPRMVSLRLRRHFKFYFISAREILCGLEGYICAREVAQSDGPALARPLRRAGFEAVEVDGRSARQILL